MYYRLNVFPIEIPPLRDRAEDIPFFIEIFLNRLNKFYSKAIHDLDSRVMDAFKTYPFPGNIRELENLTERAYILEKSSVLTPESFPAELFEPKISDTSLSVDIFTSLAECKTKRNREY